MFDNRVEHAPVSARGIHPAMPVTGARTTSKYQSQWSFGIDIRFTR
jgi:hypothetical protein